MNQQGNLSEDPQKWLKRQFEFEWCSVCGRDHLHHTAVPLMGNWFARCDLAPQYDRYDNVVMDPEGYTEKEE